MQFGLFLEFDCREELSQADAFSEAFRQVDMAEELEIPSVWLSERHFQPARSVLSAPTVIASAVATRTERVRIGIAVQVLPLTNPIRLAEEVATVDHISRGRLDFGVGRSGFLSAYEGYNIPYAESRGRFQECLDILIKAWTNPQFTFEGEYYSFHDVCVVPKPYQQPYPPLRMAATTGDTFPMVGDLGLPVFVGLRGNDVAELVDLLAQYREAWKMAGHPNAPDVALRIPIYAAETAQRARSDPKESTMASFRQLSSTLADSSGLAGTSLARDRAEQSRRLSQVTYDEVLEQRVAFGTPEALVERLQELMEVLGLSTVVAEVNPGGRLPTECVRDSIRLLGERVIPRL